MWNQILNESRSVSKFDNTPVLVLGHRHSGKRTFIDSLYDLSRTEMPKKAVVESARLRDKNLTSVIDYAYLNVVNLRDPDNRTHAKLQLFLIDDDQNKEVFEVLVSNPDIVKKMFVVIMLDFSQPWNFMTEISRWVNFLNQLLTKAGLTISQLDEMKERVQKYYTSYKEPSYDQDGKFLKKPYEQKPEELEIPVPQGVLVNNLRLPIIISVNKADLQTTVFRDKNAEKISFVQYHLREACMKYGATLVYASTKNNSNLNVFYEYILHRSYGFPLKYKSETVNEEEIFVPLGADNPKLLGDSIKISGQSYNDFIAAPPVQADTRPEIPLVDDTEFFKKYESTAAVVVPKAPVAEPVSRPAAEEKSVSQKSEELHNFYDSLMKRQSAQDLLNRHTNRVGDSRQENGKRLLETIKKDPKIPVIPEEKANESQEMGRKLLDTSKRQAKTFTPTPPGDDKPGESTTRTPTNGKN